MILYRYLGKYALDTLRDKQLKTARISSFNDPFEFRCRPVRNVTFGAIKRDIKHNYKSDNIFKLIQSIEPSIKTKKDAKIFINKNIDKMARALFDNYDSEHDKSLIDLVSMQDETWLIVCFSGSNVDFLD